MFDEFHTPPRFRQNVQIFEGNTRVSGQGFQIWYKPKGVSMVSMVAIGGGGGGGGGFSRTAGSAGGGGAGGGAAGIARFICPAQLLPDELYVQCGDGGIGGAASVSGGSGTLSYVLYNPTTIAAPNIVLASGATAPGGGGAGTGAAAGAAPAAPSIATTQTPNALGWWFATVGLGGSAGGAQTGAVGTSVTAWAATPVSAGAGGAGCTTTDFKGGDQTVTALTHATSSVYHVTGAGNLVTGGAAGGGTEGGSGYKRITPFLNCGGAGGGSKNSGQAGAGGNGGYGCGGGGGGAGTTGGRGGNGGPGLVIITSW